VSRLLSLGQQWSGSQGDKAGGKVPFLFCTAGVGEDLSLQSWWRRLCRQVKRETRWLSFFPTCRMNVLATNNESYLKSCHYSTEHPYCPIFLLGNIVRWAGSDFQEMALEVGMSLGLVWLPAGCTAAGWGSACCPASARVNPSLRKRASSALKCVTATEFNEISVLG